jgi:uncharacterized integral membrane protein (TIGR00698 family)
MQFDLSVGAIPAMPLRSRLGWLVLALGVGFCLSPWSSPATALAAGMALALVLGNPGARWCRPVSRYCLQAAVVLLGFEMNLHTVLATGLSGLAIAAVTIAVVFALGWTLAQLFGIAGRTSLLISAGTAICGGSAIAAVGTSVNAREGEMSVALGTVFLLNAVALYLFPWLGHLLGLSGTEFGTWAGVAIHDISSVVGAASIYGGGALYTATAVKLSRALWIVPVAGIAALVFARRSANGASTPPRLRAFMPWFIGLFLLASVARSFIPGVADFAPTAKILAGKGMTLALFLIGSGLSLQALKRVGWRPLAQGLILWSVISAGSLWLITRSGLL